MNAVIILGSLLAIVGVIGSIVPALPGPILSYSALVLLYFTKGGGSISLLTLGIFGGLLIFVTFFSYVAPVWGARFSGASKQGMIGACIGAIIGLVFFLPLGLFIGAFLGAVAGELSTGKASSAALKAGMGTLLGSLMVILLQTLFALTMAGFFFAALIRG